MIFAAGKDNFKATRREKIATTYPPRDTRFPKFGNILTDHVVPTGGTIGLQVEVKGAPEEVTWFRDDKRLPKISSRHKSFVESGVYTLLFPNATHTEAGRYTCRVANTFGHVDTTAFVKVVHPGSVRGGKPAMFLSRPDKMMAVATGEDISVSFRITGDPKPRGKCYFILKFY